MERVSIEQEIFRLLESRDESASICPSDVARSLGNDENWRDLMEPVRSVAGELAKAGKLQVTQGSHVVDIQNAKGPVRIRRKI